LQTNNGELLKMYNRVETQKSPKFK
jgi:hypothetical protein